MARFVYEGNTNVYWLTTIATTSTPRLNEITAGTALTNFVAKDGVAVNITGNNVDSATIAEIFDAQVVGSWGAELELTMFRDDTTDSAWNLCVHGTNGYIVIDRFDTAGTSPSNGDKVEVYPAEMHQPSPENSAANTVVRFVEKFAVTGQPNLKATVTTATS
jgi:hypothetical protein